MKKLKANTILATFIFGTSLLMLCSFGTDAAYVILSRYKLQKITEAVAIEYAASKARNAYDHIETDEEKAAACSEIRNKYVDIYNVIGSGVLVFDITNMSYKADRTQDKIVVKVEATSKVLPAFLKFVGVREIIIHSRACASSSRIEIQQNLEGDEEFGQGGHGFANGFYANANSNQTYTEFKAPFKEGSNSADVITSKDTGNGDFAIEFGYSKRALWWGSSEADMGEGGGFFVIAGYENGEDESGAQGVSWVDIGNKTTNITSLPRVCADPEDKWAQYESSTTYNTNAQCYYCINAAEGGKIIFDLAKDTNNETDVNGNPTSKTGGRTKKLTHLRVYKAGGSGEKNSDGTFNNPCDPSFTQSDSSEKWGFKTPFYKYFNREAVIKLTILNNVSLIKTSEYNNFRARKASGSSDDDIQGSCSAGE